ncbi:MAG: hypothetical protein K2O98_05945 [Lachnospiraceae bacterium]|nr:hypothetical protein [Lachnospiraceae bacterium]
MNPAFSASFTAGSYISCPFKNGSASVCLKNSIRLPMKNAVMIVPNPAIAGRLARDPPDTRYRVQPKVMQTRDSNRGERNYTCQRSCEGGREAGTSDKP